VGSLDILLVTISTQFQFMIQYIRRKLVETTSNNAPNYVQGIQNLHTFFSMIGQTKVCNNWLHLNQVIKHYKR